MYNTHHGMKICGAEYWLILYFTTELYSAANHFTCSRFFLLVLVATGNESPVYIAALPLARYFQATGLVSEY